MPFEGMRNAVAVTRAALAEQRAKLPAPRRRRDETEFLPAAVEVLETPASPTARLTLWIIAALLGSGLAWSFIGELDVVAVAEGKTIPAGRTKVIQPLESGIVRAIHVQDGQAVTAGSVLVELDPTATGADVRRLIADLIGAEAEAARLRAARHPREPMKHYKPPREVPRAQADLQRALLLSQADEHLSRLAAFDSEADRKRAERRAVEASIGRIEQAMPLLRQRFEARRELADKGFGSKLTALELQQQLVEQEQELRGLRHRRDEVSAALVALERQKRQAESEYLKTVLAQLTEAERKIAALTEDLVKAEQREGQQTLTAPIDGVVQQLAVHTVGGVVTPAQALMAIVPRDAGLEVEATILNRDIGFVEVGQAAEIKLETFLFTKYGTLPGKVVSVSRDAVPDEKRGLIYPVRIALDRTRLDVDGRRMELGAGMALTAEIKTDRRRLIDYVLSPIVRYRSESLRER